MVLLPTPIDDVAECDEAFLPEKCDQCGDGWCPIHGTCHMTEEREELERNLRIDNQSRGGRRVLRKRLRGD